MGSYLLLLIAIVAEVAATSALKASNGFTRPVPSVLVVVGYGIAFSLLALILRRLELGLVYATWSALGTAGVAVVGILVYGDSLSPPRIAGLVLVIVGVVILNLSGGTAH